MRAAILVLLALLLVPTGQALLPEPAQAERALVSAADIDGAGELLWLVPGGIADNPSGVELDPSALSSFGQRPPLQDAPSITITAPHVKYVLFETWTAYGGPFSEPDLAPEIRRIDGELTDIRAYMDEANVQAELVFAATGPTDVVAHAGSIDIIGVSDGGFTTSGAAAQPGVTVDPRDGRMDPDNAGFSELSLAGETVLVQTDVDGFSYASSGDAWLEAQDVQMQIEHAEGRLTLDARPRVEPLHEGLPHETTAVSGYYVVPFLRLMLDDAQISVDAAQFDGLAQWAMRGATAVSDRPATLIGATGWIDTDAGQQRLEGERITLPEAVPLHFEAVSGVDLLEIRDADASAQTVAAPPAQANALWAWGLGAVAMALALTAVVVLSIRKRPVRTMAAVEAAISHGRYHAAAVGAARILARDPHNEAAAVARAVALSKAGDHDAVIGEVSTRIKSHGATDGVLYYLLGLSYQKRGRGGHAMRSFRQAVRLTPSLADAVEEHRPQQGATHGYV